MREEEYKSRTLAKDLRRNLSTTEVILWSRLRGARAQGFPFRRQHPIGPYVADFACIRARLVLELDGPSHGSVEQQAHDVRRDAFMRGLGWRVFRVRNDDVYAHLQDIVDGVYSLLSSAESLAPPSVRRGSLREPWRTPPP